MNACLALVALLGSVLPQDAFDPARVNRWILSLSDDPTQETQVGELHEYLKKHGKLTLVYSKFEESFERRPKDAKLRYLLGRLQLRDGNRPGALKSFQAAVQADPEYVYTYLAQAELAEAQGDEKGIVAALEGVIQSSKEKPAVTGAVRRLADYYAKKQDLDRAAAQWAVLAGRFAEDAGLLLEAVRAILDLGKVTRAMESLRSALSVATHAPADRARLHLELAVLERRSGRPAEASQSLGAAAAAAGNDPVLARTIDESILNFYREENRLSELEAKYEKDLAGNDLNPVYIWRLARLRSLMNSLGQARDLLASGLKKFPAHPLLLSALADLAALEGKPLEVRDLSRALAAREPLQREHRKREGLACLDLGLLDDAEAAFKAYAVTPAEMAEVAGLCEKRSRLALAVGYYRRALERKPDAAWSRSLVDALVRLDRLPEAEQEAVRCMPGDRERWALLRDLLVQRGEFAKACVYGKKEVEANPKDFGSLLALGKLQVRAASDDAEPTFRKALALAGKGQQGQVYEELAALVLPMGSPRVDLLRNEIHARIKDEPGDGGYYYALFRLEPPKVFSEQILELGRKNDPRHVRLRQELAPHYLRQKQYDVAIDIYRELLEIDPSRRDLYVHAIGDIYWTLGHKDQAFGWWGKVQGSGKEKAGISFQLAKKYEAEKRYAQAIDLLQQVLKEDPANGLYHWALAQIYRQVNNLEGLVQEYKWILAYSKEESHLRAARQVLSERLAEHARSLVGEGKYRLALQEFTEALRYAPDEPATGGLVAQMARACECLREYAGAADYYHQILSRYPGVAVIVSTGRTMNAALFASNQLRGNPELLQAYEDLVGPASKQLLQDSMQKADRAGLERVVATYPLSTAAGIAAFCLGESCRKEGAHARAAAYYERILSELSLAGLEEAIVRIRLIEISAQLKDWGTASAQLGELFSRSKDQTVTIDGRTVVVRDFLKHWQKEILSHGVGLSATWGLLGKDARNSSSTLQELAPPLVQKWRYQAAPQPTAQSLTLPAVYAAGGVVFVAKEDTLVALDGSSGIVRWTAPLKIAKNKIRNHVVANGFVWGHEGRLAVSQGVVCGIDGDNELRAFDASSGATLWARSSDVPRADGMVPARIRGRGVAMAAAEHMEVLSATRQCVIVREGDKLRAYALRTGRIDWQADVTVHSQPLGIDSGNVPVGGIPTRVDRLVLESDGVLVHVYGDSIRAIDTLTGRDLWEIKVPQRGAPGVGGWSSYFMLLTEGVVRATIAGELLVYLTATEGKLTAVEVRTGKVRWDMPCEGPVTDSQLASDDQNVYVLLNKSLAVHSAKTGVRLWRKEARTIPAPNRSSMPPVPVVQNRMSIAGSRIYLTSGEDEGDTAKLEALDRRTGNTLWTHEMEQIGRMIQGVRALGTDIWGRAIPSQLSAPVVCDGWLYVVRSDGALHAFHGKTQELLALREAVRRDPDSPIAHFQLGDLLGSEGQTSLEIEEYRTALRLAQKKAETSALRELITEARSRLFVRFMKQGESSSDLEAAYKAFVEARAYADGEPSLARVLVRTAAVLLALKREVEAFEVLSSLLVHCPGALSPLDQGTETAGEYAKRQLARLGPDARAQWEKAHAEEIEKAFAPGRKVEEIEKAIERYSFSSKADPARVRAARLHFDQKRFLEVVQTLDRLRPEFWSESDAEAFFGAYDLLARALTALGEDRRALGLYQKMLTEISKDAPRLGSLKERVERRHKELRESWERNGTFSSPLQTVWESPVPAAGAPKPAGSTMDAFRPAVDRGRIYVLDPQGTLQALDAATVQVAWQAKTEDFSSFFQTSSGLTVLPMDPLLAVRDDLVAVGGKLTRVFDGATGTLLWTAPSPDGEGSVVHQLLVEGDKVLTCETKGRVSARDGRTGKLLWSTRAGTSATGIISDRSGSSGGGLVYSRIGAEGTRVVIQPAGDPATLHGYDLATGKLAWKTVDASYPGYLKGRVLMEVGHGAVCLADPTGLLVCRDLPDGKVRWKASLGVPIDAILMVPDRVVLATADQVLCLNARTGKKDWASTPEATGQPYSKDKDMRIGATSLAARGKWLVVGSAASVSIVELATGQVKDQARSNAAVPAARPGGKLFPFGRSFASVAVGPEGIFWGVAAESGCRWTLLR